MIATWMTYMVLERTTTIDSLSRIKISWISTYPWEEIVITKESITIRRIVQEVIIATQ